MEAEEDGPVVINNNPSVIKAAQEEMGRLDVLVCGQCHSVFHFIEEFQEHRSKEGACSKNSHFRDNGNNEQKAQVWAFLLWKDSQIQQEGADRDSANSWKLYQKWCKMEANIRESWVTAGKTIQTFTKISNAKMQEAPRQGQQTDGVKQTVVVRKVIRNGQPDENEKREIKTEPIKTENQTNTPTTQIQEKKIIQPRPKTFVKPKFKPGKGPGDEEEENQEEFPVEKIMAKRFNTKKKCHEYLLKWEGFTSEHNSWESSEVVNTCKYLLEEFERNLAKQKELKELKAQQQLQQQQQQQQGTKLITRPIIQKTLIKQEASKPGPSTAAQVVRPMRSSKSKAMDQVKQWCGSMKDEETDVLGKRRMEYTDSDSEDATAAKRIKGENTGSDDDWTGESEEERLMGRSDVIQRAFNRANAQSNGSNKTTVVTATELITTGNQTPVLVANAKGVVKVDPKQMPNLSSGVYVMSRKEGIIKLDSSQSGKLSVKGQTTPGLVMVQNREIGTAGPGGGIVRKQVLSANQANSITPVKVVQKPDGSQVVTQMKVISKPAIQKSRSSLGAKNEPIKIQPKPDPNQMQQIHVVTAVQGIQPRMTTTATIRPTQVQAQKTITTTTTTNLSADGRPLLPRPTQVKTPGTPISNVIGVASVRTPLRAPGPKQINTQVQQQRQTIQKKIIPATSATSLQTGVSPNNQIRPKFTVLTSQPGQVVKTVSPSGGQIKQSPKTPGKPSQSLLSPQQKLLMAKRKAQEAAGIVGNVKTQTRTIVSTGQKQIQQRRGKPIGNTGVVTTAVAVSPVTTTSTTVVKPKETKIVESDGLHMEFQQVGSEDSSDEIENPSAPTETPDTVSAQPDSPPRPFTLCPLTGRIIGPDGEPMETAETQPEPEIVGLTTSTPHQAIITPMTTTTASIIPEMTDTTTVATATAGNSNDETNTNVTPTTTELILPSLESLTESGGVMRVEMSPGGTTGTIVQADAGQLSLAGVTVASGLPSLDDTPITTTSVNTTCSTAVSTTQQSTVAGGTALPQQTIAVTEAITTSNLTSAVVATTTPGEIHQDQSKEEERRLDDPSNLVTITGEDGVVYQVAGHAEDGQTLLVTRGADGEQQCVYVTTDQQADDGSVLTLDHAVAEAVAQLIPDQVNLAPQFYVKEGEDSGTDNQMVMSIMDNSGAAAQEDPDAQAQVVAQVVQADDPTPGGTRRVVLLLPDGNLMMTEVDEEQYAALELDK